MHTVKQDRNPWRPLISVDFDGVLHQYDGIWSPGRITGDPVPGAIKWLVGLYCEDRCDVAISSARSRYLRGQFAMRQWMKRQLFDELGNQPPDDFWEVVYDWLKWPIIKPGALIYIDDRAYCFEGSWPTTSEMLRFQPWNRRTKTNS